MLSPVYALPSTVVGSSPPSSLPLNKSMATLRDDQRQHCVYAYEGSTGYQQLFRSVSPYSSTFLHSLLLRSLAVVDTQLHLFFIYCIHCLQQKHIVQIPN